MDIFSYIFSEGTWFGIIDNGILVFVSLFGVNLERRDFIGQTKSLSFSYTCQ